MFRFWKWEKNQVINLTCYCTKWNVFKEIACSTHRYTEKEVANKVNMFRKMLMAKEGVSESSAVDKDEHGRPMWVNTSDS